MNCYNCGHIIRTEVKEYRGHSFDTRCHRNYITQIFDALSDDIPLFLRRYFRNSGKKRADLRIALRRMIGEYKGLSY